MFHSSSSVLMSKHEDPFLNYFFVPLYATDTKCSFMSMTLLSAMTTGNNFHFIPYFRVLLATNVGTPLVWFWSPFLCRKSKNPNQQQQQKKKVFWFFQCCLGWQKTPGFSQCLGLFLYNGEGIFFFWAEYGHARTWGQKPNLFSTVFKWHWNIDLWLSQW